MSSKIQRKISEIARSKSRTLLTIVLAVLVIGGGLYVVADQFFRLAATNVITNTYDVSYGGVSIQAYAEAVGAGGQVTPGLANVTKGGRVRYTLTVTNPDRLAKSTEVKFELPPGFVFDPNGSTAPRTPVGNPLFWDITFGAGQETLEIFVFATVPTT